MIINPIGKILTSLIWIILISSCTSATDSATANAEKKEKMESLATTLSQLISTQILADDNSFGATVLASSEPIITIQNDEKRTVEIPIGTEAPVHCSIWSKDVDPPSWLQSYYEAQKKVMSDVKLYNLSAGGFNGRPYFYAEELFTLKNGKTKSLNKLIVANFLDHSVMCQHNMPQNKELFITVASKLISTMEFSRLPSWGTPSYHQLSINSINNNIIGYTLQEYYKMADSTVQMIIKNPTMLVNNEGDFLTFNDTTLEYTDGNGTFYLGLYIGKSNSGKNYKIQLEKDKRKKRPTYLLKGEYHDKKIDVILLPKKKLVSSYQHEKALGTTKEKHYSFLEYLPNQDPLNFITVEVKPLKEPERYDFFLNDLHLKAWLDKHGRTKKVYLSKDGRELTSERIHTSGKL